MTVGSSSIDPEVFFREVLKGLRPLFKQNGYQSKGQNFAAESLECWAVINLQKSRWSASDEKTFYVNVGITAKRHMQFEDKPIEKAPAYFTCMFYTRAESFGPEPEIGQWTVRDAMSARSAIDHITTLLSDCVLPAVGTLMTEAAILKRWSVDSKLGYQQLKSKAVLLAARAEAAELKETLLTLERSFGSGVVAGGVRSHIDKLTIAFPKSMASL